MSLAPAEIEAFCLALPGAAVAVLEHARSLQVAGSPFAAMAADGTLSFRCSSAVAALFAGREGIRVGLKPKPGHWLALDRTDRMEREELLDLIRAAYGLAVQELPEAERSRVTDELRRRPGRAG